MKTDAFGWTYNGATGEEFGPCHSYISPEQAKRTMALIDKLCGTPKNQFWVHTRKKYDWGLKPWHSYTKLRLS